MMKGGEIGWKGRIQVIPDRICHEPVPFPVKVVVMGGGKHLRLYQNFGDGQSQGDVHGNRQGIFRNQDVDFEFFNKGIDVILELLFDLLDLACQGTVTFGHAKTFCLNLLDLRMGEMGLCG